MDRFILIPFEDLWGGYSTLKSNMDRFIYTYQLKVKKEVLL